MNCFNHPDVPAVGMCKACQKGLCMECAVDLGHGIACKNHREEVEMLNFFQFYKLAPMFLTTIGLVLSLGGAFMDTNGKILSVMGLGMIVPSLFFLMLRNILHKSQNEQSKKSTHQ